MILGSRVNGAGGVRRRTATLHPNHPSRGKWNETGGPCTPTTGRCRDALNPKVWTPRCCIDWGVRILADVTRLLDWAEIPWWADYGTNLGYLLGGKWYWNDKDTDINCLVDDRERVRELIGRLGDRYNIRYYEPSYDDPWVWGDVLKVRLSKTNWVNCDITFWLRTGENGDTLDRISYGPSDRYKGRAMPYDWVFPTTRGLFEGVEINVPAQPELIAAHRFGEDWRCLPAVRHRAEEVP